MSRITAAEDCRKAASTSGADPRVAESVDGATHGPAACAVLAILVSAVSAFAQAQGLTQSDISVGQARRIVDAIIAECSPGPLLTVSIAVVDRAGQPIVQVKADTGHPHNWELSFRKAYTARTYRRDTLDWKARTDGLSERAGQRDLTNVIPIGGGVPIVIGSDTIGGVGVTGAPGGVEGDAACAAHGAAAVSQAAD